jgi:uncharacterized protein YjiS (DUF1127 family)
MFLINFLISAAKALSEWRRREQAYAELMALDDHALADIGLHRSQLAALVDGGHTFDAGAAPIPFRRREKLVRPKAA